MLDFKKTKAVRSGSAFLTLALAGAVMVGCSTTPAEPSGNSSGNGSSDDIASMDPVTLTVSLPFPATFADAVGVLELMDYVTEKTDSKVTFDVYDSGTLHPMSEAISALESGLSDITMYAPTLATSDISSGAWAAGLAAFTYDTPLDALAGSPAAQAMFVGGPVVDELAGHNAVVFGAFTSTSWAPLCTSPMETLADAQGMLLRTSGGTYNAEAEAIGTSPVLMDGNETYEGLQRGTLDCTVTTPQTFYASSLGEVAKYWTELPFSPATMVGYMINKEKWDAFPETVREIFREAAAMPGISLSKQMLADFERLYATANEEYGVTIVTPAKDLASRMADFRREQGETLNERAPESVTDPQAMIDLYKQVNDEWVQIIRGEFGVPETDGSQESMLAALQYISSEFDWEKYRERIYEYTRDLD